MRNKARELKSGVVISPREPGYLLLSQAAIDRIIITEPIENLYNVEEKPFARGKSAVVRRCRDLKSGRQYAAKFLKRRRSPEIKPEILHEVAVLEACRDCPRVVSLHQVFDSPTETVLLLELAHGGELQTLLDKDDELPSEAQVVRLMRQILEGIVYLHSINVAHLDLKPQNLVLTGEHPNYDVKLCDFGISRYLSQNADVREILGTPDYVAPEVLNFDPISLATDMWSVGVLMYVLLTGCSPFGGDTKQETFSNITECRLDFPEELFGDVSQEAQDLMTKLMVKEPSARLTATECLQHSWFSMDFSDPLLFVPSPVSTPLQRTPVPSRKETLDNGFRLIEEPVSKRLSESTETLLPSQTSEENDNLTGSTEEITETVIERLDNLKLDDDKSTDSGCDEKILSPKPERKICRTDSIRNSTRRISSVQTMPVQSYVKSLNSERGLFQCKRVFITDELDDPTSPPMSISGSSSGSSISSGIVSDAGSSDSNSDTVSDMSIDSSSDRSSIISLDESMDFGKGHLLRSYNSCYNIWEGSRTHRTPVLRSRESSENFALIRSVFANDGRIHFLGQNKLTLFNSNLNNKKTVALKTTKEQNSNIVTITEVKPVVGKRYVRTTELKCETVQSRIRKLKVYAEVKPENCKDLSVF